MALGGFKLWDILQGIGGFASAANTLFNRPNTPQLGGYRHQEGQSRQVVPSEQAQALGVDQFHPGMPNADDVFSAHMSDAARGMDAAKKQQAREFQGYNMMEAGRQERRGILNKAGEGMDAAFNRGRQVLKGGQADIARARAMVMDERNQSIADSAAMVLDYKNEFQQALQRTQDYVAGAQKTSLDQATKAFSNLSQGIQTKYDQMAEDTEAEMRAQGMPEAQIQAEKTRVKAAGAQEHGNTLMQYNAAVTDQISREEQTYTSLLSNMEQVGASGLASIEGTAMGEMGAAHRTASQQQVQLTEQSRMLREASASWEEATVRARSTHAGMVAQYTMMDDQATAGFLASISEPYFDGLGPMYERMMSLDLGLMAQQYNYDVGDTAMINQGFMSLQAGMNTMQGSIAARRQLELQEDAMRNSLIGTGVKAGTAIATGGMSLAGDAALAAAQGGGG